MKIGDPEEAPEVPDADIEVLIVVTVIASVVTSARIDEVGVCIQGYTAEVITDHHLLCVRIFASRSTLPSRVMGTYSCVIGS